MRVMGWPAFKNRAHNPYNSLLYGAMGSLGVQVDEFAPWRLLRGGYDVLHLHWPDASLNFPSPMKCLVRTCLMLGLLRLARLRGTKLVWTMHNLKSHEGPHPSLERFFWRRFPQLLHGCISLSEAGHETALEQLPALCSLPAFVVPHGHYRGVYPDDLTREQARRQLNVPAKSRVLLYLGMIRPYKNVPHLIRTFRSLSDPEAVLLLAGKPFSPAMSGEIESAAAGDARVKLFLGFVLDADLQRYLRAADLVVLPFTEFSNSGSALLALSFDCPILMPRKGTVEELRQQVGDNWVRTYDGNLMPDILQSALRWALETTRPARAPLEKLDWPDLARQTVEAYRQLAGRTAD
ncbi:MAG: glycosyltransferase family 4 protein [Verrucomicrobia bacterium]|nr:glycosyltransferase family 4 protein [Verrucomicrobiota bacterium]